MPDNFGQLLRDGTSQVAQDLTPAPAHLVRARGSQRSRRKAAGTTVLAVVLIAAGGGGAYALSQQPHSAPSVVTPLTQTPTPTAPATTPGPTITPTQLNTPTGTATPPRRHGGDHAAPVRFRFLRHDRTRDGHHRLPRSGRPLLRGRDANRADRYEQHRRRQ